MGLKTMAKSHLKLVGPAIVNGTVPPRRLKNSELRTREYLTPGEVEKLLAALKGNRNGHRDSTMVLLTYRHGLRVAELVDLHWNQVNLDNARLHVRRVKKGDPSVHPLKGDEMRALRRLKREAGNSEFVFTSERGAPFSKAGFAVMIARASAAAGLGIKAHAHMLRHATGYKLASDGVDTRTLQAYLGHRNIQHTVRYTAMSAAPFRDFWRD